MQRNVGLDTQNDHFLKRPAGAHQGFVAGLAMDDQLGDQAVVIGRHLVAGIKRRIDTDAEATGGVEIGDLARRGHEGHRIFGVDAAFDGMAGKGDVRLAEAERGAGGDADLFAHQIDAGDHFRDRMFDLEPRVHFDKIKFSILEQKFDGAD